MLTRDAWRLTMRTMILAIGTVIAALSIHAGPASAQNYPWCAHRGESTNCGFVSYEQCRMSSGWCDRNPMYQPPTEQRSGRRPRG
jgi:hypothetical protein